MTATITPEREALARDLLEKYPEIRNGDGTINRSAFADIVLLAWADLIVEQADLAATPAPDQEQAA